MRVTLSMLKDPSARIDRILGIPATDARYVGIINQAIETLLNKGKWWGTTQHYQVCVTDSCLTWPRQFATIEKCDVCSQSVSIRNQWFEFEKNGPGLQSSRNQTGGLQLFDRGTACAFTDITGTNKKIKVYASVTESGTSKILLQGYDENGNWIRTQVSGAWVDGEYVTISTSPATSTKKFSSLVGVQKPITNGSVRLYSYNTDDTTEIALAYYEPDETVPQYRRSYIPSLCQAGCCGTTSTTKQVNVMAKIAFIPLRNDTDYSPIGCIPAIKDMCQSIKLSEDNLFQESAAWEAKAISKLQEELRHHLGSGTEHPIHLKSASFASGAVENLI